MDLTESNLYEVLYLTGTGENSHAERIMVFTGNVNLVAVFVDGKEDRIVIKVSKKYTHILERARIVAIVDANYNGEQNDILIQAAETRKKLLGKD